MTDDGLRILITGSRDWTDHAAIRAALVSEIERWESAGGFGYVTVAHGAARGADLLAAEIAVELRCPVEPHPADWSQEGKAAGVLRNGRMVALGADVCLAFPLGESRGTRDCMARAEAAGIPVHVIERSDSMTAAELAECWVPVPMRWRNITAGDVIVGKDGKLWTVAMARQTQPHERRGGQVYVHVVQEEEVEHTSDLDPDEVATVLLPAALRDAMELSRDQLGARLLERRGAA